VTRDVKGDLGHAASHGDCTMLSLVTYAAALIIPACYLVLSSRYPSLRIRLPILSTATSQQTPAERDSKKPLKSIMQAARTDLAPPKDDPFTTEELKQYDGSDPSKPIYVAIKGMDTQKNLCSF